MEANIEKETNKGYGVTVYDNNNVKHKIGVLYDGEISGHIQDGYPDDPEERTEAGNEHVNQARRFARYWVYRKRGYETLEPLKSPDQIAQAATVLKLLSDDTATDLFGDLYHHLQADSPSSDSPIELPDGVGHSEAVYQQDIYLGMDEQTASTYAEIVTDPAVIDLLTADTEEGVSAEAVDAATLLERAGIEAASVPNFADGALIEAVSGVHIHWDDVLGQYHTKWGSQPALTRDPDARFEIFAFEPETILELNEQLVRNLLCQVRDCYLTMGIAPPEAFRILGHGRHDASTWYAHYDFYEEYFDPDADIDVWYEDHTPEDAYEHNGESTERQIEV